MSVALPDLPFALMRELGASTHAAGKVREWCLAGSREDFEERLLALDTVRQSPGSKFQRLSQALLLAGLARRELSKSSSTGAVIRVAPKMVDGNESAWSLTTGYVDAPYGAQVE